MSTCQIILLLSVWHLSVKTRFYLFPNKWINITIWQVNKSDGRNMPPYVQGKTLAFWFTGLSLYLCNFCHYFNCILPLSKVIIYEAFNIFIRIEAGCFHHLPLRFWRKSENWKKKCMFTLWSIWQHPSTRNYEAMKLISLRRFSLLLITLCIFVWSLIRRKKRIFTMKKSIFTVYPIRPRPNTSSLAHGK